MLLFACTALLVSMAMNDHSDRVSVLSGAAALVAGSAAAAAPSKEDAIVSPGVRKVQLVKQFTTKYDIWVVFLGYAEAILEFYLCLATTGRAH